MMTPDPASAPSAFTVVASFNTEPEANLAKSALNAAGIPCVMHRDDCGGLRPALTFTQGIQILVPTAEAARAAKILA